MNQTFFSLFFFKGYSEFFNGKQKGDTFSLIFLSLLASVPLPLFVRVSLFRLSSFSLLLFSALLCHLLPITSLLHSLSCIFS